MFKRFLFASLLCLTGWTGSSNASLLGVCTFAGGCGPDFFTPVTANYVYNAGSDSGVLTLSGNVGNSAFLDGQLDSTWANTINHLGNPYGNNPLLVLPGTGTGPSPSTNDEFNLSFTVDGNGNLIAGTNDVTMNGRVIAVDSNVAGNLSTAISYNGTALDGSLITGGTIEAIGWAGSVLDFTGQIDGSSLLTTAGYGQGLTGILSLGSTVPNIVWDQSWSGNGTLDVVVPVPAAVWLFVSGLLGLTSLARRQVKPIRS